MGVPKTNESDGARQTRRRRTATAKTRGETKRWKTTKAGKRMMNSRPHM